MGELSEKDFDRIERFILGKLSEEEQSRFQKEVDSNPDLKKRLKEEQDLIKAVETEGLQNELESIHNEIYPIRRKRGIRPLLFSVAATVAVLIGFSIWYVSSTVETANVYAEYAYTDPGLPIPMSATDNYDFYDAMVDYKTEAYATAIGKWKVLLEDEPQNDTLVYYIGAAYFNLEDFKNAKPFLEKTLKSSDSAFTYKAQYTIFLSEVKRGNIKNAMALKPFDGSPFKSDIRTIQESLNP